MLWDAGRNPSHPCVHSSGNQRLFQVGTTERTTQIPTRQVPQHLTSGDLFEVVLVFDKGRRARPSRRCAGGDNEVEVGLDELSGFLPPIAGRSSTESISGISQRDG